MISVLPGDVAGAGAPLACIGVTSCPTPGALPDGVYDFEDLRALEFARGKYSANCGYLVAIDANGDDYISDAEVDSRICVRMLDLNGDLFVDFFDYDIYVGGFNNGDCFSDTNGDGFLDFFDYDRFVELYEGQPPCPQVMELPVPDCGCE